MPDSLIAATLLELEDRFGAVSCETQLIEGHWRQEARRYRDRLTRVFVDVPDTAQNKRFFRAFKEKLKKRFGQLEIWMTTYLIEVF